MISVKDSQVKKRKKKMKKLIMLIATVAAIGVSQAATVTWSSGSLLKGPSGSYMAAGDIKMYVFEFADADAYAAADIASLDLSSAKLSGATTKSTTGITLTDTTSYGAGDTIYSAVIFSAKDSGKDYIMGAKFTETIDALLSRRAVFCSSSAVRCSHCAASRSNLL